MQVLVLICVGCKLEFEFPESTALLLMLNLHPLRGPTVRMAEELSVEPAIQLTHYFDGFGNRCGRALVPAGRVRFRNDAIVDDCGLPDLQVPDAPQVNVQDLPQETLQFLLASRYCEVDSELKAVAWSTFSRSRPGWERV
jgi:hypothetical protein